MRHLPTLVLSVLILFCFPCTAQQWKKFATTNSALISNDVTSLAKTTDNKIYAATARGLSYFNNDVWQTPVGGAADYSLYGVWSSSDSVWLGTEFYSLWGYFGNTWKSYEPNTSGNGIIGFAKSSKDSIYKLDKFGRFSLYNGTDWIDLLTFFSNPNNLFIDRNDAIWLLSGNMGITRYKDGEFTTWQNNIAPESPNYIPSGNVFDMIQDKLGIYWMASDEGLLRFDGTNFQVFNTDNSGLASNRTRCVRIDLKGDLWIGTWDAGLCKFTGNTWTNYTVKNSPLTSPIVNYILVDTANSIWIANGYNRNISPTNGQGIYVVNESTDLSNGKLPNAPSDLGAKVISENKVILSWVDNSDNEAGFLIERSTNDSFHFEQIKMVINDVATFNDITEANTIYYYRIRSDNSKGYSVYSNTIKVQPKYCATYETLYGAYAVIKKVALGNIYKEKLQCVAGYYDFLDLSTNVFAGQTLMLTVNFDRCNITSDPIIGGVVYIDWNADGDFEDQGEQVFSDININGNGEFALPITVPANALPGTITRMRVRTEDDVYSTPILPCGYAEETQDYTINIVSASASYIPTNLFAKGITSKKIYLRWQDNANQETEYIIERSVDSINFSPIATLPFNSVQFTDSAVQPNTNYYYRVIAKKSADAATSAIIGISSLPADLVRQYNGQVATDIGVNGGAYWGDYNNDGKYDLYVPGSNILYINQNAVLNKSNIGFHTSSSAAWGDFDNDGDQDIYITDYANGFGTLETYLYENNGNGSFTPRSIIIADGRMNNCVWTDYNKDGFLDLYISYSGFNYGKLYRNNGDKTFSMVRKFENTTGFASFADYDNDGDEDLFVLGSYQSAIFTLQDTVFTRNTTNLLTNFTGFSYGHSWGDFNNDGNIDLFLPNSSGAEGSYSSLYINLGKGNFQQRLIPAVDAAAYGSAWGDYDNDGNNDIFVARYAKTNKLLRNVNGAFNELPESVFVNEDYSESPYNERASTGCAWADYDRDGFLDLFVAENSGLRNTLYKNGTNQNKWVNLLLQGTTSNRNGIGAMIKLKANSKWQYRWVQSTSGFAAENSIAVEFGLGTSTIIDSIIVTWPSGIVQEMSNVQPNVFMTVIEPNPCSANRNTWTGAVNNKWENPGNWSCGIVPAISTDVIVPAGSTVQINSNVTIKSLKVSPGSSLTVSSGYSITILK